MTKEQLQLEIKQLLDHRLNVIDFDDVEYSVAIISNGISIQLNPEFFIKLNKNFQARYNNLLLRRINQLKFELAAL